MRETRTGGIAEFNKAMRRWLGADLNDWVVEKHKEIHIQVLNGMVYACPVGNPDEWLSRGAYSDISGGPTGKVKFKRAAPDGYTGGRARGGFQSSTTTPQGDDPNRIDPSGAAPKAEGRAVMQTLKPWSHSYITNNVEYILALNDRPNPNYPGKGWSKQAPLQWMEAEVEKVENWFKAGVI